MNTLVLFYSYSGHSAALARQAAQQEEWDIAQIRDKKRPGKLAAFTAGCLGAMRGRAGEIAPLDNDLSGYTRFVVYSPIWAGNVPPAVNAALSLLPQGSSVLFRLVSASGQSKCAGHLTALVKGKGGTVEGIENIQS